MTAWAVLVMAMLTSCISVSFNGSGYDALSAAERSTVVECREPVGSLCNDGHVYLVTTEQLQQYLDSADAVLVYEYAFYCRSEHCLNPASVEDDCQRRGVRFLLLMEDYGGLAGLPALASPVLAVNPAPFGKKLSRRLTPQFLNRLTSTTYKTRGYGRYYLFLRGQFAGCFVDYNDAFSANN